MTLNSQRALCLSLVVCYLGAGAPRGSAAEVSEIVRGATAALNSDWSADPEYACIERNEIQNGGAVTSKTFEVLMIDGSDYRFPLAVNDEPLSPERQRAELLKLKSEIRIRKEESPAARRARIEGWKKRRDEDGELLLDFNTALKFKLLREETRNGRQAYVLSATPKQGIVHNTRAAKVLSGMQGMAWVEKDTLQPMRVECTVMTPVPVFGPLASVLPGTRIEIGMTPVTESTWLIDEVSMKLSVAKVHMFKSTKTTRSTYSQYRPNSAVLEEFLSR
ncbi:MAG TPA: hypothetical protein VNH18_35785 [Bryobacteraceae bacterium]|nr:hypothetical protein [Bryobacteraceae bacterium]